MSLLVTPLHPWHVGHGAKMSEFGGWDMPIQYTAIIPEHQAVRRAAGLFDICHMGRLKFSGPDSERFLNFLTTNDVSTLQVGQIQYSLICNELGGVLDDVLVYRFSSFHLLVVNASNRQKILDWIERHRSGFDVSIEDLTTSHAMIAVQGPMAECLLTPLTSSPIASLGYYTGVETFVMGESAIVSRTGYTGEDGFEVILAASKAELLWTKLLDEGKHHGVLPAGLGCRDTLRLEAAMPLYGHELNENLDPFTAGLSFAIKLNKGPFFAQTGLVKAKETLNRKRRIGIVLSIRRIAREGAEIFDVRGVKIGVVTSGTLSPTLDQSIAMGYVETAAAVVGESVEVDVRGQRVAAQIVKLPFYRRSGK